MKEPNNLLMIAEDETSLRKVLAGLFRKKGYSVNTAPDGEKALEQIRKEKPQVIVSDIMMPGVSGKELCRRVKSDPELKDIYFIMLTARDTIDDEVEGLALGADDYITKPFHREELLARVNAGVRSRQFEREIIETAKQKSMKVITDGICSHFNNIFTGIGGMLELAVERNTQENMTEAIHTSTYNLKRASMIVENLRYFCSSKYINILEKVNLSRLLEETLGSIELSLGNRDIVLEKDIENACFTNIDPKAFSQVFFNIISNSVQAIGTKGTLTVGLKKTESGLRITFENDGPRILPELIGIIFDPFFSTKRLTPGTSITDSLLNEKDIPGQGLGLAVTKGIIEAHNCTITTENMDPCGVRFTIEMPVPEKREKK